MKRFNLYVNSMLYSTETDTELYPDLKESVKQIVDELICGESHTYKNNGGEVEWEIERIV